VNMPYLICSSNQSSVGEDIIAIGTPLTLDFKHTVTKGIISALNRTLEIPNQNGTISYMQNLIQHDASINAGNSGGPIINSNGEVVGINTLKVSDAEGLGFAIPISVGKTVIEKLSVDENWTPSYMGVFGLDTEVAIFKGEKLSSNQGVYVANIDEDTICKDYFKKGDVIVDVNGHKILTLLDLRLQLYKYKAGDILNITVIRNGEPIEIRYHMLSR
ncbi:MAG: trypsin-like peptidase domain-containing protein, partial [Clostridia bacterium]|nr:trypsin-like peptidase domain-containing protein [Clostridia bacterium]